MAKDTFQSESFKAKTFACGTLRGGAAVAAGGGGSGGLKHGRVPAPSRRGKPSMPRELPLPYYPLRVERDSPDERRDEPKLVLRHPTPSRPVRLPRWLATGQATVTLLPPGQRVANAGAIVLPRLMLASDSLTRTVDVASDAIGLPRVRAVPTAVGHWDMAAIAAADEAFLENMMLFGDG